MGEILVAHESWNTPMESSDYRNNQILTQYISWDNVTIMAVKTEILTPVSLSGPQVTGDFEDEILWWYDS